MCCSSCYRPGEADRPRHIADIVLLRFVVSQVFFFAEAKGLQPASFSHISAKLPPGKECVKRHKSQG